MKPAEVEDIISARSLALGDDGAFADYVAVEAAKLFAVPEGVSQRHAAIAEPLACGIHATNLLGDIKGKDVVVIGPGIIGLSAFLVPSMQGQDVFWYPVSETTEKS